MDELLDKFETSSDLTEEEQEALDDLQKAYDRVVVLALEREFKAKIVLIDDDHLLIDGVLMDNDAFDDWLTNKYFEKYNVNLPDKKHYTA